MRIRFSVELRMERRRTEPAPGPPEFEHRDNDGTLSENVGHPRYIGFMPQRSEPEERAQ